MALEANWMQKNIDTSAVMVGIPRGYEGEIALKIIIVNSTKKLSITEKKPIL